MDLAATVGALNKRLKLQHIVLCSLELILRYMPEQKEHIKTSFTQNDEALTFEADWDHPPGLQFHQEFL